jgi:cardiolipin synthase (CMP-forming)
MPHNLANLLTMSRIAAIPLVVALLYLPGKFGAYGACAIYGAACVTDWLDGHVARRWGQPSEFGRFLDPIADKLLVAATLLVLVAQQRIAGWWVLAALVILCRELLVSGLREFLAGLRVRVPVSRLSKWKTAVQMVALGFLIVGDMGPPALAPQLVGEIGLAIAAIFTLYTGYDYLRAGLTHMDVAPDARPPANKREAMDAAKPARSVG